jgi:tRNA (guanine-N7-)-methyltransferase
MSRLRGPIIAPPEVADAWSLLNQNLYGSHEIGGHHTQPSPDALPWSWNEHFDQLAPLLLEIGFNRGKFITALAEKFPHHNVVGIEIRRRFAWRLAQIIYENQSPKNLRVIWGDAKILVPHLFTAQSLQGLFITFPDPWWKKRHEKRRLVDTHFAEGIADRLTIGGKVWVKSDVGMIADEIKDALCAQKGLGNLSTFEQDDLPLTHREQSCIHKGMPIHRFCLTRLS